MSPDKFPEQRRLEKSVLEHVSSALEEFISSGSDGQAEAKRLSSIRFVSQSLNRYMDRLFAIEEYDGYSQEILEDHPELMRQAARLLVEHEDLRAGMRDILRRLDLVSAGDGVTFHRICNDLRGLIHKLRHHNAEETDLLEEAFQQDTGGEGG